MKTHEFAVHLEQLARLLRRLPDTELDFEQASSVQDLLSGLATPKRPGRLRQPLREDIENRLELMSPAEIEAFLLSEEEAFTATNLLELAGRIGINASRRQSKSALVNMITRHYEALKMHSIMRSAGPHER